MLDTPGWKLEQLGRSIVMLPTGHSIAAVSKGRAEELLAEVEGTRNDIGRYRKAVDELGRVLASLDSDVASARPEVL